jgi:hypothetical protein
MTSYQDDDLGTSTVFDRRTIPPGFDPAARKRANPLDLAAADSS